MNLNKHITKTLLNEYAGSEKKKTILMDDGNKYLLKFPDPIREKGRALFIILSGFQHKKQFLENTSTREETQK